MIRVLHIVSSMNRGGLETYIMNMYRKIDTSKVQFDFLVHTDKKSSFDEEIYSLGGRIFSVPSRNKGYSKNLKALNTFFKTYSEYKIVHQHVSSLTYIEPLKIAKKYKVPVRVLHSHSTRPSGSKLHKYIHRWNQFFVKSYATHFFACSDLAARWLYGRKQYAKDNFNLIKNGIETKKYSFNEKIRKSKRKELGLDGKLVVGHVGRFAYPKNHNFLINVFESVNSMDSSAVLLLIGDGELRPIIEEKVTNMKLNNKVIFTGIRDDISELLQAIDILVFPSFYEGFPVSLIEVQASGLNCIISNTITEQVGITDLVTYKSLDDTAESWAKKAIQKSKNIRVNNYTEIKKTGFDVLDVVEELQCFYINAYSIGVLEEKHNETN